MTQYSETFSVCVACEDCEQETQAPYAKAKEVRDYFRELGWRYLQKSWFCADCAESY